MIRRPSNPATGVCHHWCLMKFVIILWIWVKMVANLALKNIKFKFQELFYWRESHSTIISNNQRYTDLYIYTYKLFTSTYLLLDMSGRGKINITGQVYRIWRGFHNAQKKITFHSDCCFNMQWRVCQISSGFKHE